MYQADKGKVSIVRNVEKSIFHWGNEDPVFVIHYSIMCDYLIANVLSYREAIFEVEKYIDKQELYY